MRCSRGACVCASLAIVRRIRVEGAEGLKLGFAGEKKEKTTMRIGVLVLATALLAGCAEGTWCTSSHLSLSSSLSLRFPYAHRSVDGGYSLLVVLVLTLRLSHLPQPSSLDCVATALTCVVCTVCSNTRHRSEDRVGGAVHVHCRKTALFPFQSHPPQYPFRVLTYAVELRRASF